MSRFLVNIGFFALEELSGQKDDHVTRISQIELSGKYYITNWGPGGRKGLIKATIKLHHKDGSWVSEAW